MKKFLIPADKNEIENGLETIRLELKKYGFGSEKTEKMMPTVREAIIKVTDAATDGASIEIVIKRLFATATVIVSAEGRELKPKTDDRLRAMILSSDAFRCKYTRRGDVNKISVEIGSKRNILALSSLVALLMGIVAACLIDMFLPEDVIEGIGQYVLIPIQTFTLNALKLVTAPAVLFAIMTFVADYISIADTDRINRKIILCYAIGAMLAVVIAYVIVYAINPLTELENTLGAALLDGVRIKQADSVFDIFKKMVPDNMVIPFLNTDSVQLMLLAVLCGVGIGKAGKSSGRIKRAADTLNDFFSALVNIVNNLMPYAIFFIITMMILSFGMQALIVPATVIVISVLGFAAVFVLHMIIVAIKTKLNPFILMKKVLPCMKTAFFDGSSISAISETRKCCEEKLGISSQITAFSIPFGAMSNLEGNCVYLSVAGLILSRLCGIDLFGTVGIELAVLVVVLSIGSPITPGSAMLALTLIMSQMGIPIAIICLLLGVNIFVEMMLAANNVFCDTALALCVAKKENMLDTDVYNKL